MRDSVQIRLPLCTACFVTVVVPAGTARGSVPVSALRGGGGEPAVTAGVQRGPTSSPLSPTLPVASRSVPGPPAACRGLPWRDSAGILPGCARVS